MPNQWLTTLLVDSKPYQLCVRSFNNELQLSTHQATQQWSGQVKDETLVSNQSISSTIPLFKLNIFPFTSRILH